MLILCTVRPISSRDEKEFRTFNYDASVPRERLCANAEIERALRNNCSVLARRIAARLPHHPTILQIVEGKMKEGTMVD